MTGSRGPRPTSVAAGRQYIAQRASRCVLVEPDLPWAASTADRPVKWRDGQVAIRHRKARCGDGCPKNSRLESAYGRRPETAGSWIARATGEAGSSLVAGRVSRSTTIRPMDHSPLDRVLQITTGQSVEHLVAGSDTNPIWPLSETTTTRSANRMARHSRSRRPAHFRTALHGANRQRGLPDMAGPGRWPEAVSDRALGVSWGAYP